MTTVLEGVEIEPKTAIETITKIKKYGESFLIVFNDHVDPNSIAAAHYECKYGFIDYLTGKYKDNGNVGLSIVGGWEDPIFSPPTILGIGLQYNRESDRYGARILPTGTKHPPIKIEVMDKRLRGLANQMYHKIRARVKH